MLGVKADTLTYWSILPSLISYRYMEKQQIEIGGRDVLLYQTDPEPQVLLIQTMGKQEYGSIDSEVQLIGEAVKTPFVMAAFAITDWEVELTP